MTMTDISTHPTITPASKRMQGLYLDDHDDDSSSDEDEERPAVPAAPPSDEAEFNKESVKRRKIERPKITVERLMDPEKGLMRVVTRIPRAVSKSPCGGPDTADISTDEAAHYLQRILHSYQDIILNDWLSLSTASGGLQDPTQKAVLQDLLHKIDALGGKSQLKDHVSSLRLECGRNPHLQRTLSKERATQLLQQFDQYTASAAAQQSTDEVFEAPHASNPPPAADVPNERIHRAEVEPTVPVATTLPPISTVTTKRRFILEDSDDE